MLGCPKAEICGLSLVTLLVPRIAAKAKGKFKHALEFFLARVAAGGVCRLAADDQK
jgi:hypothetical protein